MIEELMKRYPELSVCREDIASAVTLLINTFQKGGKLLICGNGGSCADSDHIVGELMKGFLKKRPLSREQKERMKKACPDLDDRYLEQLQGALPAVALPSFTALNTAFCNDVDPELLFAQQILGLGKAGDVLLGITTSGNSKNVVAAAKVAKSLDLNVLALTGQSGGRLKDIADICIKVPQTETYKVQELHLPVYHVLCAMVEDYFFKD